jgi:glutathionylspermidine synthase
VRREASVPRLEWQRTIEGQGLVFWRTQMPDGTERSYWTEDACYVLSYDEAVELELAANELVERCVDAAQHVIDHGLWDRFGIPPAWRGRVAEAWEREPPMVAGRFDLAYLGEGHPPKLLEYNADTPTAMLESAVVQWMWLQDSDPTADQLNSLHERLIERWTELSGRIPGRKVHFLWSEAELSGEDRMTVEYLADTCRQAGLEAELLPIEQLGFHDITGFVTPEGERIATAFKLYPWEWMWQEEFGEAALRRMGDVLHATQWIEPLWKVLWSNKALLTVLWELFPDHPNLLPAYAAGHAPPDFGDHVRKPLLAREGANAMVVRGGDVVAKGPDQGYGQEGYVVQALADLGTYDSSYGPTHPVFGVWTVDMTAAGLGIRESDSLITDNLSRFVPHKIEP